MKIQNLVIDDLRFFIDETRPAVYARTGAEGIQALTDAQEFGVETLWLDHDLGELEDGTDDKIMGCVDFLAYLAFEGTPFPVDKIVVHTDNPSGRRDIIVCLERWGYPYQVIPATMNFYVPDSSS